MVFDDISLKRALLRIWPKYLFAKKRLAFKRGARPVSVADRLTDRKDKSYVEPWAFIRVKNERLTLQASLNSILPAINKGVIAYNPCTDGSDKIIEDFCKANPGFIPLYYDKPIIADLSSGIDPKSIPFENTLAGYYQAALDVIPKGAWIKKIDVDMIYYPEILKHSFSLLQDERDWVSYSRLNLYLTDDGEIRYISYVRPGDDWLVYNDGLSFDNKVKGEGKNKALIERLVIRSKFKRDFSFSPECSAIHFPYQKKYRRGNLVPDKLMSFEDYALQAPRNEISDAVLDLRTIQQICRGFCWDGAMPLALREPGICLE